MSVEKGSGVLKSETPVLQMRGPVWYKCLVMALYGCPAKYRGNVAALKFAGPFGWTVWTLQNPALKISLLLLFVVRNTTRENTSTVCHIWLSFSQTTFCSCPTLKHLLQFFTHKYFVLPKQQRREIAKTSNNFTKLDMLVYKINTLR